MLQTRNGRAQVRPASKCSDGLPVSSDPETHRLLVACNAPNVLHLTALPDYQCEDRVAIRLLYVGWVLPLY